MELDRAAAARIGWQRPGLPHISAELRNWLLCWIVLPNVAFAMFWAIGAPPRHSEIVMAGAIGLLVRQMSYRARLLAFAGTSLFSLLSFIAAIFNLAVSEIFVSLRFFAELAIWKSPVYLIGGASGALILALGAWLLRRGQNFSGNVDLAIAVAALASVTVVDYAVSFHSRGSYKRVPAADTQFESARSSSDLMGQINGERHVLVVMVEAMGLPRNAALREQMMGRWARSDIAARYDVRYGSSAYYGSTTNGEIRELCGRWSDYSTLMSAQDRSCLPFQLKQQGYDSLAVHGFTEQFFDRRQWYPNIGFSEMIFGEQLLAGGLNECPGVFPGACDTGIPALLGQRLKSARKPLFAYWLTLNSHLPVPSEDALATTGCAEPRRDGGEISSGVCRLATVVSRTMDSLAVMLVDPNLPATDILIVGDHMPPFFDHGSRSLFDEARVPWIRLTPKANR